MASFLFKSFLLAMIIGASWVTLPAEAHDCNDPAVHHPGRDNIGRHSHQSNCDRIDDNAYIRAVEEYNRLNREGRDSEARESLDRLRTMERSLKEME